MKLLITESTTGTRMNMMVTIRVGAISAAENSWSPRRLRFRRSWARPPAVTALFFVPVILDSHFLFFIKRWRTHARGAAPPGKKGSTRGARRP